MERAHTLFTSSERRFANCMAAANATTNANAVSAPYVGTAT